MTSHSKTTNQATLPGMEQALCACGCGRWFMRVTRGRKRLYLNDTHKKRVMRAKRQQRASETVVRLTPKGIKLAERIANTSYTALWDMLTPDEQWVLHLAEQHPSGMLAFWQAVATLQRRADAELAPMREELESEYENG